MKGILKRLFRGGASATPDDGKDAATLDRAPAVSLGLASGHYQRGNALQALGQVDAAIAAYDAALRLDSGYAEAHCNRGGALQALYRMDEALACYDRAIAIKPEFAQAHSNRGIVLESFRRFDAALASYERAIAIKPDFAEAHFNCGQLLQTLGRLEQAVASYDRCLAYSPQNAAAHFSRAEVLRMLRRFDAALAGYDDAMAVQPEIDYLYGMRLHTKMLQCDWRDVPREILELRRRVESGRKATLPFPLLALIDSPSIQLRAARSHAGDKYPTDHSLGPIAAHPNGPRMRIGYFSADFHNHVMAYLLAEMFELHDRNGFEWIAFSFGPQEPSEVRSRLIRSFDRFIEVGSLSDQDAARLAREAQIDIAVDLSGYTGSARPAIFAHRAAPIQAGYLGYPGTMGAGFMDYLIADRIVVPEQTRDQYAEKIVRLPGSYQVNDRKRPISERRFTRAELGLPESGFVFCCFNNNYKILPATFDGWMRILRSVPGSVLWLFEDNARAAAGLRSEAQARSVDASRLVFAQRMPGPDHLARHRQADLFVDTLPYNAHTTASDALWAGLPILTQTGESFASRVAASVLHAVGLPELVTHSQEEYEALAIALAQDPPRLTNIREKLDRQRKKAALFDTPAFTRHLETAYRQMVARNRAGLPPEHIDIESCSQTDPWRPTIPRTTA